MNSGRRHNQTVSAVYGTDKAEVCAILCFFSLRFRASARAWDSPLRLAVRWPHTSGKLLRIQVLRQKIHQIKRASAIDHLEDQITLAARQFLDHALRRGPDGLVRTMDTCRQEQHQCSVSEVHR